MFSPNKVLKYSELERKLENYLQVIPQKELYVVDTLQEYLPDVKSGLQHKEAIYHTIGTLP